MYPQLNILFLGCIFSEIQKKNFFFNSTRGYQFAAQNFQESLLDGFLLNGIQPYVLTIPSLSTFPLGYKKPFVDTVDFIYKGQVLGKSIGFCNIPFIKAMSIKKARKYAEKWIDLHSKTKYIIVYGLHSHLMSLAVYLKQMDDQVKICVIALDLPQFMGCNKYYKKLGLQKKNIELIYKMIPYFDCYVVLSELMVEVMEISDKRFLVIEGIYSNDNSNSFFTTKIKEKVILYTGGLFIRYGIKDLVDAFMNIVGKDYKLWFCGNGDAVNYIQDAIKKDDRIVYKGVLPKDEILKIQKEVTLLVNPRHSDEMFTKYSFPSKTMEYMASGTPVLMARLESLPKEYYEYLFFFNDESVEGMSKTMKFICDLDSSLLINKGFSASQFILKQKNAQKQTGKILDLLMSC